MSLTLKLLEYYSPENEITFAQAEALFPEAVKILNLNPAKDQYTFYMEADGILHYFGVVAGKFKNWHWDGAAWRFQLIGT